MPRPVRYMTKQFTLIMIFILGYAGSVRAASTAVPWAARRLRTVSLVNHHVRHSCLMIVTRRWLQSHKRPLHLALQVTGLSLIHI